MSETPSIDKSTQETNDISQGFLTWEQVTELRIANKSDRYAERIDVAIWQRQRFLTAARIYDNILVDYYDLMKKGKL